MLYIDVFSFIADFSVVTALYFNHFEYNKHGYKPNNSDNFLRFICLGISILVVFSLIIRYNVYKEYKNVKYMMSLKASVPSQRIKKLRFTLEILCHIIQPYPYLSCNFEIEILGNNITYSLDMILFSLSIINYMYYLK